MTHRNRFRKLAALGALVVGFGIVATLVSAQPPTPPGPWWPSSQVWMESLAKSLEDGLLDGDLGSGSGGASCGAATNCAILEDLDEDGDYADDFQRVLNALLYPNYLEQPHTGEALSCNKRGCSGTLANLDVRQGTLACSDGALQNATDDGAGAITGDVGSTPESEVDEDIGSSLQTWGLQVFYCVDQLPIVDLSSVSMSSVHAGGTQTMTCDGAGACTGDGTANVNASDGCISWSWDNSPLPGENMLVSYDWALGNTVNYATGEVAIHFDALPDGSSASCDYSQVEDAVTTEAEILIHPPAGVPSLPWGQTVRYCLDQDYSAPTGADTPQCSSNAGPDTPYLVLPSSWTGVQIACDLDTSGTGIFPCLWLGDLLVDGPNGNDRVDTLVRFDGMPRLHMLDEADSNLNSAVTKTPIGLWLDGVGGQLRLAYSADPGLNRERYLNLFVAGNDLDVTLRNLGAEGHIALDGDLSGVRVRGSTVAPDGSGSFLTVGTGFDQRLYGPGGANGCTYNYDANCENLILGPALATAESVWFIEAENFSIDLVAQGAANKASVELLMQITGDLTPEPSFTGVNYIRGNYNTWIRLHCALTAAPIALDAVFLSSGIFSGTGVPVRADCGRRVGQYDNLTKFVVAGDFATATTGPWYSENPSNANYDQPGWVDDVAGETILYTVGTHASPITAAKCLTYDRSDSVVACTGNEAQTDVRRAEDKFVGRVEVKLLADVPDTDVSCDFRVLIDGNPVGCDGTGEPACAAGGAEFVYGGVGLRDLGDTAWWNVNDELDAGSVVQVEIEAPASSTLCELGSSCACDSVGAMDVSVRILRNSL